MVVLASAFTAKRNFRPSILFQLLWASDQEKRGRAFAQSTSRDEGQKRKKVVRVCKGAGGTLPHLYLVQRCPHQEFSLSFGFP